MSDDFNDEEAHQALDLVEQRDGITDEDIIALLKEAEDLVRRITRGGKRVILDEEGRNPRARPPPPLRYSGPGAEDNYSLILHSERYSDSLDADPAFWGLGVSSPMLKHEQEWLDSISGSPVGRGRYIIEEKQPIFTKGEVTGVVWKGTITHKHTTLPWTMIHYKGTNASAMYINGRGRRIFQVKIW